MWQMTLSLLDFIWKNKWFQVDKDVYTSLYVEPYLLLHLYESFYLLENRLFGMCFIVSEEEEFLSYNMTFQFKTSA